MNVSDKLRQNAKKRNSQYSMLGLSELKSLVIITMMTMKITNNKANQFGIS